MPSKFSQFAKATKELEAKAKNSTFTSGEKTDIIPNKEKNPDDLELQ